MSGITIIDPASTYELQHSSGAIFILKHWTCAMQDEVDRQCLKIASDGTASFDIAKDRELKVSMSVAEWKGVNLSDGSVATCDSENKRNLPPGIVLWLQKNIEEKAGLRITELEKKN